MLVTSCHGCVAQWRDKSEGTISLTAGMTRAEAQRRSTIPLREYGDSNYYFDFVLAGESLRFHGNSLYSISAEKDGRISGFSALSANQTWSEARHDIQRTERMLLERGWKRDVQLESMDSLPTGARAAGNGVNYDTSIRRVWYYKGDRMVELTVAGLWGGIPWYRIPATAKSFWRVVGIYTLDPDDLRRIRNQ
jgi:hypothetical protein